MNEKATQNKHNQATKRRIKDKIGIFRHIQDKLYHKRATEGDIR